MKSNHVWNFFRAGGFDQVRLDSAADLLALPELDQKLWVALSCPTRGIEFDSRTLDLIDADGDGKVRANEILASVHWLSPLLKNSDSLVAASDQLMLSNIDDSSAEGAKILASARHVLQGLGKPEADKISLLDLVDIEQSMQALPFNGDGVVTPQQVAEPALRRVFEDIIKLFDAVADKSGDNGINQKMADTFFMDAESYLAWQAKGEADPAILLLGNDSSVAATALHAVKEKINDYFIRCQMAAYDARAASYLSRSVEDYELLAPQSLSVNSQQMAGFPLSTVAADKPLSLLSGINPAWQAKIEVLRCTVLRPLLGELSSLTVEQWQALCARFAAFEAWQSEQPASRVGELGGARLREVLGDGVRQQVNALIEKDVAVAAEIKAIASVEKLIRYQRDLFRLANNFVSFRDFYSGKDQAIFQMGELYMDGRTCELCIRVEDVNAHAVYANSSGICLAYCELVRNGGAEKMNIAAAFTAGDSDFLKVGRHGIFYDRRGKDWDATIVRIADHPISIRQAFWLPYKKVSAAIAEQMQKFAASKADAGHEQRAQAAGTVLNTVASAPNAPLKPAFDVAKFAGIFAAIGLAIGAIGGMMASLVSGIVSLKLWQIPLALAGLMLAVSGPSMMLAWFKLKHRNLGPILDACGWAINARVLINIPFGTSLTALPCLPKGAQRSLVDPYAEKKSVWPYLGLALLVVGLMGWFIFIKFFSQ